MTSIAFIIPYFGKWPIWFPAFLKSCESNPTIHWLFFTNCNIPLKYPPNVKFFEVQMEDMATLFTDKIGTNVTIQHPVKFCDLKPTYGHVFEEYLKEFDFWGFCDIDIIWGDIRAFVSEEMLNNYDLISSRKKTISGHFTILRNNEYNRMLYKTGDYYKELFQEIKYSWFDENTFASIVLEKKRKGELNVWWDDYLVNHERDRDSHQEYYLDRWIFDDGKLFDLGINGKQKVEHMYLHFINWKTTMLYSEVNHSVGSSNFYISYIGIHNNQHNELQKIVNDFKNIFNGYYKKEWRRIFKKRVLKKADRLKRKLSLI